MATNYTTKYRNSYGKLFDSYAAAHAGTNKFGLSDDALKFMPVYQTNNGRTFNNEAGAKSYLSTLADADQDALDQQSALSSITSNFENAQAAAKAANESRYQQLLDNVGSMSSQQSADANTQYNNIDANNNQKLLALGMGGTTVGSTLQKGTARERIAELNRIRDNEVSSRNQIIESRTDSYPDSGQFLSLLQGFGQSQGFEKSGLNYMDLLKAMGGIAVA